MSSTECSSSTTPLPSTSAASRLSLPEKLGVTLISSSSSSDNGTTQPPSEFASPLDNLTPVGRPLIRTWLPGEASAPPLSTNQNSFVCSAGSTSSLGTTT